MNYLEILPLEIKTKIGSYLSATDYLSFIEVFDLPSSEIERRARIEVVKYFGGLISSKDITAGLLEARSFWENFEALPKFDKNSMLLDLFLENKKHIWKFLTDRWNKSVISRNLSNSTQIDIITHFSHKFFDRLTPTLKEKIHRVLTHHSYPTEVITTIIQCTPNFEFQYEFFNRYITTQNYEFVYLAFKDYYCNVCYSITDDINFDNASEIITDYTFIPLLALYKSRPQVYEMVAEEIFFDEDMSTLLCCAIDIEYRAYCSYAARPPFEEVEYLRYLQNLLKYVVLAHFTDTTVISFAEHLQNLF